MTMSHSTITTFAVCSLIGLSACGGGGGGGDETGSFFISPGTSGDQINSSADATIAVVGARSNPSAISIRSGKQTIDFAESDGALISNVAGFVQAVGPGDQEGWFDTRQTYVTSGRSRTTRDQTGPYSDEIFLVGVDGTLTTDMPGSGEVVYQGQALGYSYTPSTDKMYTTRSDIVLTARFADNDVFFTSQNGVIFHPDDGTVSTSALSLTGKLAMDGGQFSGAIDGPGGSGTVGTVDGAFYGPGAIEAGGVFQYDYGTFAGASSFSTTSD